MELKNFARAAGYYLFAEALCLFLTLTLAVFHGTPVRAVSTICTIGVLICLCVNFAVRRGREDQRSKREDTARRGLLFSAMIGLPYLLLGIALILARAGVLPDTFFRWYKLLDAAFWQLCNIMSIDVQVSLLRWPQVIVLAVLNLIPPAAVWISYRLTLTGFDPAELQYRKRR